MNFRELTDVQIEQLRKECEDDIKTKKLSRPTLDMILYKLAWSDGAKAIMRRLDYLPDAKS